MEREKFDALVAELERAANRRRRPARSGSTRESNSNNAPRRNATVSVLMTLMSPTRRQPTRSRP